MNMNSGPAPVAVFAYNRPDHLKSSLQSLLACDGADAAPITVFIDGPKTEAGFDTTEQVRLVAASLLGTGADIRVAPANRGLSSSIISGVGDLTGRYGSVIVVEDDLMLAPPFLTFMNQALARYRSDERVLQVTGYNFDVPEFYRRKDAIFLPLVSTWGWATWHRAWRVFDAKATGWERLRSDRKLSRRFDLYGAYPYTRMMERQQQGKSDSWGIRWYWSLFKRNGVSLFPPVSMVINNGQDGSGTHGSGIVANFQAHAGATVSQAPQLPNEVAVGAADFRAVRDAIWRQNGGWMGWALNKLRRSTGI